MYRVNSWFQLCISLNLHKQCVLTNQSSRRGHGDHREDHSNAWLLQALQKVDLSSSPAGMKNTLWRYMEGQTLNTGTIKLSLGKIQVT